MAIMRIWIVDTDEMVDAFSIYGPSGFLNTFEAKETSKAYQLEGHYDGRRSIAKGGRVKVFTDKQEAMQQLRKLALEAICNVTRNLQAVEDYVVTGEDEIDFQGEMEVEESTAEDSAQLPKI